MRIIVPGKDLTAEPVQDQCLACGCVFEYFSTEVARVHDWIGTQFTVKCPHCRGTVRKWKEKWPVAEKWSLENVNQQGLPSS